MPSIAPSKSIMKTRVARVPYLNSAPFFRGLQLGERYELTDCVPRELGAKAARGEIVAGLMPLVEFIRLEDTFERLGRFGIAVRGRGHSAILFARRPLRALEGAVIAVTEETSTTICLLRLILEQRYQIHPASYQRGHAPEADALLLIGDEALRFRQRNGDYPFEIDVAFEWWLWQHLPMTFAVWAIRKDADAQIKKELEVKLARAFGSNADQFEAIAKDYTKTLGMTEEALCAYLSSFVYRFGQLEEQAILHFRAMLDEHQLLS